MASSLALKRLLSTNLLTKSLCPVRPVASAAQSASSRFFNTNAVRDFDDDDNPSFDVDRHFHRALPGRRYCTPHLFSDVFDPFSTTSRLSQILNMTDKFMDSPYRSATHGVGAGAAGLRHGWDAKETEDGFHLRIDMPGLGKDDVKVCVEKNTLIIKGEGEKESDDEESGRRYSTRIELPEKLFKTSEIKAEVKNGVLKVVVPKVKGEERTDVFHVKIE